MKVVMLALLLGFLPRLAAAQNVINLQWTWNPPAVGAEQITGYMPYVCIGACDESGVWLDERNSAGDRVVFPSCQTGLCVGVYQGYWPIGATYSFRLTATYGAGQETDPSNILVLTRPPPSTTVTTPPTTTSSSITVTTVPTTSTTTTTILPFPSAPILQDIELSDLQIGMRRVGIASQRKEAV